MKVVTADGSRTRHTKESWQLGRWFGGGGGIRVILSFDLMSLQLVVIYCIRNYM